MDLISYAQNFEDVILWRALREVTCGTYLDIGAHAPERDSVSKLFYDRGWRGVHVEPDPTCAAALRASRPDEVVIEAMLSDHPGIAEFFRIPGTGLSTGKEAIATRHKSAGHRLEKTIVPTLTLGEVFEKIGSGPIHFMKIDVEGMEADVLRGWSDHPARPWILVIESTFPNSQTETHHEWIDSVWSRGYAEVYFDGLSRFFVHDAHHDLGDILACAPNVFDSFAITGTHFAAGLLNRELLSQADENARCKAEHVAAIERLTTDVAARDVEIGKLDEKVVAATEALTLAENRLLGAHATVRRLQDGFDSAIKAERDAVRDRLQAALVAAEEQRRELLDCFAAERAAGDERLRAALVAADEQRRELLDRLAAERAAGDERLRAARAAAEEQRRELLDGFAAERAAGDERLRAALAAEEDREKRSLEALQVERGRNSEQLVERDRRIAELLRKVEHWRAERDDARMQLASLARSYDDLGERRWTRLGRRLGLIKATLPADLLAGAAAISQEAPELPMSSFDPPPQGLQFTSVPALLALEDAQFVQQAYRSVLGREPDADGMQHYLAEIREGWSKVRILRALRKSHEASNHVPGVAGLDAAIRRYSLGNLPLVGPVASLFVRVDRESAWARRMRRIERRLWLAEAHSRLEFRRIDAAIADLTKTLRDMPAQSGSPAAIAPSSDDLRQLAGETGDQPQRFSQRGPLARFFESRLGG